MESSQGISGNQASQPAEEVKEADTTANTTKETSLFIRALNAKSELDSKTTDILVTTALKTLETSPLQKSFNFLIDLIRSRIAESKNKA